MQPKISVIIPVYNMEKYLRQCLESVCSQTLEEIQILVVDDGSTDGSGAICQEFAERYPDKLRYFYKENGGSASARNVGLEHAAGEYIGFVDSDDWVELNMYERMYAAAVAHEADIVFCRTFEDECPGAYEYIFPRAGKFTREDMTKEIFPYLLPSVTKKGNFRNLRWCNWLHIYKRSILEEHHIRFNSKSRRCEDLGFSAACTIHGHSYFYLEEPLYHNRPNQASKSRNYSKDMWLSIRPLMIYLQELTDECREYDFDDAMNACIFYFCTMVIRNEMRLKDKRLRRQKIQEVLDDSLCKEAVSRVWPAQMNLEYQSFYRLMFAGDGGKLMRHLDRQRIKKEKLFPMVSAVISLPGIRAVYKAIRNR